MKSEKRKFCVSIFQKNWKLKIAFFQFSILNRNRDTQKYRLRFNSHFKIGMEKYISAHFNFYLKIENWKYNTKYFQFSIFKFSLKTEKWKFVFAASILEFNCQVTQLEISWLAFLNLIYCSYSKRLYIKQKEKNYIETHLAGTYM